tara:strand:+ start:2730 stop:2978 length:249 start_codon:yes stop_codon:yes gene_type:complete
MKVIKDTPKYKVNANINVRDSNFRIEIIYNYQADTTELVMPDKLRLLPKIHMLAFLKDTAELVQSEHSRLLDEYNKEGNNAA